MGQGVKGGRGVLVIILRADHIRNGDGAGGNQADQRLEIRGIGVAAAVDIQFLFQQDGMEEGGFLLAVADEDDGSAVARLLNALQEGDGLAAGFHAHIEAAAAGDGGQLLRFIRGTGGDHMVRTEVQGFIQPALQQVADGDLRALGLGGQQREQADGAGSHHQHPVAGLDIAAADGMAADGEGLDQRQLAGIQPAAGDDPLQGHADIFTEGAVPLDTHGLVVHAGIDPAFPAGIAGAAVEIRVAGDQVSGLQAPVVIRDGNHLGGKFMARNPGIGGERLVAGEAGDVRPADSAVQDPEQGFPGFRNGHRDIPDFRFKGLGNADRFHERMPPQPSILILSGFQMTAVFIGAFLQ